jgi:hypothetical protein
VRTAAILAAAVAIAVASAFAELNDKLSPALDHPAIEYFNYLKHPGEDVVGDLKRKIAAGKIQLRFDDEKGYLPAVLQALNIPVESQMAVFSKTSFQASRIEPGNPRTIFFNDSVAVAWMHGGFIELAAQDPKQGVIFYTLEQQSVPGPSFVRRDDCLSCHRSDLSLGVPGMILRSFYTLPDGRPKLILGGFTTDHRSPFEERWGGWYVTGSMAHARHMGNAMLADPDHPESMITDGTLNMTSLQDKFDTNHYLSAHSDMVALLVFDHQMYMTNLITRVGWEVRCALYDHAASRALTQLLRESANELVDYLLFIDEAPLPGPVHGTSGFAEKFAARGPLRQLDLKTRLLRYPCSYMIYGPAFDSLPEQARGAIYQRLWDVLSGVEKGKRYARLSLTDRQAIVEILRATKPGLPHYFQPVTR